MTFEQIVAYMTAGGWPIDRFGDNAFRSSFSVVEGDAEAGDKRTYTMLGQVEATYFVLLVLPLARLSADEVMSEQLMERLLELNEQIVFAKFSLDEDADVILSVEIPVADMSESQLQDALDVLTHYTNEYAKELQQMAEAPSFTDP